MSYFLFYGCFWHLYMVDYIPALRARRKRCISLPFQSVTLINHGRVIIVLPQGSTVPLMNVWAMLRFSSLHAIFVVFAVCLCSWYCTVRAPIDDERVQRIKITNVRDESRDRRLY